jgi:hypothetical protein
MPQLWLDYSPTHNTVQEAIAMSDAVHGIRITITKGFASPAAVDVWTPEATLGRSADATIRFDPQRDTGCSRSIHARLVWLENAWWIECLHESGIGRVESDRVASRIGQRERARITTPGTFELGLGGPRFEVASLAGTIPATEVKPVADVPISRIHQSTLTKVGSSHKRILVLGTATAALALAAVVVAIVLRNANRQTAAQVKDLRTEAAERTATLLSELSAVKGNVQELSQQTKDRLAGVLQEAAQSVWLVGLLDGDEVFTPVGTAWVVASQRLATNAHVALALREGIASSSGIRIVARRSSSAVPMLEVSNEMLVHPGYERWSPRLAEQFEPGPGGSIRSVNFIPPADVALLTVSSGDPGKPLQLAAGTAAEDAVNRGRAVGYVGYPCENVAGFPTLLSPSGRITATTDFFFDPDAAEKLLVHHDAVITGGASGSPLLNEEGLVVAIVSAGSMIFVRQGPNSMQRVPFGLNYAQRASLIQELLDNTAAAKQAQRDTEWDTILQRVTLPLPRLLDWLVQEVGMAADSNEVVTEKAIRLTGTGAGHAEFLDLTLEPNATYLVLAVSHDRSDIDIVVFDSVQAELGRDDEYTWHPMVALQPDSARREVQVVVFCGDTLRSDESNFTIRVIKQQIGP